MARSASIDPLAFHHFNLGVGSIIGKYYDSKAEEIDERLSEKNINANPLNWHMCWWTGMGIYCSVFAVDLEQHERLFLRPGVKDGTAAVKYCEQLFGIVGNHEEEIMVLVGQDHLHLYGLCKGAGTHAISGTTASPSSLPSIARRGEWSLGAVLDVYWHFASIGDHYLGRILAGLDPNTPDFGTLPPHWTNSNPLENDLIKKAMVMLYGPILVAYEGKPENPAGLLLRCLSSLVFHADALLEVMVKFPGHDFTKISIFHDGELLDGLKKLVTTDPTPVVMTVATGIPPHVGTAQQLAKLLNVMT
jgi:hypothetical protein